MIYIKDMDRPVDCLGCRISCKHESYMVIGRPADCPLEEAKTGDIISRADAIDALSRSSVYAWSIEQDQTAHNWALNIIKALPSAEAVQGEWIDIDNYYRLATCSHCHKVTMFEKWGEDTKPYNFCPNCGARMKGGDSE